MTINWKEGPLAAVWLPVLNATEKAMGIPTDLLARQCYEESRFNPRAKNVQSGAVGLMQLLPKDFPGAGENPIKDISDGAAYDMTLFKRFNDWQLALAGYDWGPTILAKTLKKPGFTIAFLPIETQDYVTQIIRDVPVRGILCKTPSLPSLPAVGGQPNLLPLVLSSGSSSGKSWYSRVSSIFRSRPVQPLESPSGDSLPLSAPISSQTNLEVNSMINPNPVLVAVAPEIQGMLAALTAFDNAMGADPVKWAQNFPGAKLILDGTMLQQLIAAEPALGGLAVSGLNGFWASLSAKVTAQTTAKPAPVATA